MIVSAQDRLKWDRHYTLHDKSEYPDPDPLLFLYTPLALPAEPQRALDLAGGVGQNALWIAEQGYTVDLMDISRVALLRAQQEMTRRRLRVVNLFQVDLEAVTLQPETYDLVCVFRFWSPALMAALRAAVKPGGRVIYETFNSGQLQVKPNFNPRYVLQEGELLGYFGDWDVLHHAELSATSQVVAVKPR